MSDTDNKDSGKKTLGIRASTEKSHVRQSFSHGRSKAVVVEKKRKRVVVPQKQGGGGATAHAGVSDAELERRRKALEAAKAKASDDAARRADEEKRREAEMAKLRAEKEEREAEQKRRALEAEKARQEAEEKAKKQAAAPAAESPAKPAQPARDKKFTNDAKPAARPSKKDDRDERKKGRDSEKRRSGKLTINQAFGEEGRQVSMAAMKRRQERERRRQMEQSGEREKITREVQVPDAITVQELANRMAERAAAVVKLLMTNGIMATQNQTIDAETATLVVEEFGHKVVRVSDADVEDVIGQFDDPESALQPRAPVITIMGHVDHGKTSLLDAIRKTSVVSGEAGGITQHIGAYQVNSDSGTKLTFLDTPGHAAFTSMRARGAQVTDIVVLVVAADDSVMPQTIEAIHHARAAKVPMIVAINKIDLPAADAQKVRTELLQHEVIVESLSGEVVEVEVSAHTGQGLSDLLEMIALQAEVLELDANPDRPAEGAVIEAKLDVGRGPVATVLVQKGTLKQGDIFVVGEQWGKVRALVNDMGDRVTEAGPSVPVEVLGLNGTPEAGDVLNVVPNEGKAREIADYRAQAAKDKRAALGAGTTLDQLLAQKKASESSVSLPILVKADVQGSAEAIVQAMEKVGNEEVRVQVLHSGVGAITETDVTLAEASGAPILGFNVRANAPARESANQKGVEIRYYSIIYDLVDDIKQAASGLLSPELREHFIGYAEIREVFKITGVGKVAGCMVTEGVARRSAGVRLLRDDVVIHEGTLKTLKRFKDEVKEVQIQQECGMAFENYDDIRPGDRIEIFEREEIERVLD